MRLADRAIMTLKMRIARLATGRLAFPAQAVTAQCAEKCYSFAHLHDERFSDSPNTEAWISRKSG